MLNKLSIAIAASAVLSVHVLAQNNTTSLISLPYDVTYLLPNNFTGNLNSTFVNGTTTSNSTINALLANAKSSTFISYDDEFTSIFGANPQATLIAEDPGSLAYFEAGVWMPERDEVWLASSLYKYFPIPFTLKGQAETGPTLTQRTAGQHQAPSPRCPSATTPSRI